MSKINLSKINLSKNNYSRLYDVYQYIVVGHEMIGKTSIINKYFDGVFLQDLSRTFAVDFRSKHINVDNNTEVIIRIWDTAGQERFDAISHSYYNKGDCVFLCFSIFDRFSFERLEYYLDKVNLKCSDDSIVVLVGTFGDKDAERVITLEEIKEFAFDMNLEYFEISSKTGIGIKELFNRTINLIYTKRQETQDIRKHIYNKMIHSEEFDNQKSKCCF
jgi:small GTP-binding protein